MYLRAAFILSFLSMGVLSIWALHALADDGALATTSELGTEQWNDTSEEKPPIICPQDYRVTGISCAGSYCDNVTVYCWGSSRSPVREVAGTRSWTRWVEPDFGGRPEGGGAEMLRWADCGKGVMAALECRGSYCDDIRIQCTRLVGYDPDLGQCRTIPNVSEESGRNIAKANKGGSALEAIVAIRCSGQHCDNKDVKICRLIEVRR